MKRFCLTILMLLMVLAFTVPANAERFPWVDMYDAYVTHELELKAGASMKLGAGVTYDGSGWALTRSFELPLASFVIDGAGASEGYPLSYDGGTAPGLDIIDGIPAIIWASPEVTPVQYTFRLPSDYSSGLSFRVLVSSSNSPHSYDWSLFINKDSTAFDAAANAQTSVEQALSSAEATAKNEILTFSPNSSALADLAAGNYVTLSIWRVGADSDSFGAGNAEVKGITGLYEATR